MIFTDREEAAQLLAQKMEKYKGTNGVVLAVPRGGIPLGYIIAKTLRLPLDVLLSKKIGHPHNKEYAIGAVTLDDYFIANQYAIPPGYIQQEVETLRAQLRERYRQYIGDREPVSMKGKTVIIVDDGVATGNTIIINIALLRKYEAAKVVIAVPVSPRDTFARLQEQADEVICLHVADDFQGVGQFYLDFSEVPDEEAVRLLNESNRQPKP